MIIQNFLLMEIHPNGFHSVHKDVENFGQSEGDTAVSDTARMAET